MVKALKPFSSVNQQAKRGLRCAAQKHEMSVMDDMVTVILSPSATVTLQSEDASMSLSV